MGAKLKVYKGVNFVRTSWGNHASATTVDTVDHGGEMTITKFAHYAIRSTDLEASRHFYTQVMGFRVGYRPPFSFPGIWLYQQEDQSAVVHIIGVGVDPDEQRRHEGYCGMHPSEPGSSTGSFDHVAFLATDWLQVLTRCETHRVAYVERNVAELGLHQVFLRDPSGVTLELNYPVGEGSEE
jgi:catechol 2,3-dioxygenase-like lactoylglutathione lyase family enzyme